MNIVHLFHGYTSSPGLYQPLRSSLWRCSHVMWKYFSNHSMNSHLVWFHALFYSISHWVISTLFYVCLPLDEFYTPHMCLVSNPLFSHWMKSSQLFCFSNANYLVCAARLLFTGPFCCCPTPYSKYLSMRGRSSWSVNVLPPTLSREGSSVQDQLNPLTVKECGYAHACDGETGNRVTLISVAVPLPLSFLHPFLTIVSDCNVRQLFWVKTTLFQLPDWVFVMTWQGEWAC